MLGFWTHKGISQTYASLGQEEAEMISEVLGEAGLQAESSFFEEDTPIKMELTFDFKKFLKNKKKDEYQPAEMRVVLENGEEINSQIRIRARGNFRRDYCQFPPIKLNFKKANIEHPELASLEKVKLVTSCRFQTAYQQYIFKEYLVYKAFNELTDKSYKVRMVDLTYLDSQGKKKPFTQFGFLIEETDKLAERMEGVELETEGIAGRMTETDQMALVSVFQYMIGNTDWSVQHLHNLKLIRSNDPFNTEVFIVPYDFDYCGLVDAYYAIPHEDLGIEDVQERLFRGYCFTPEVYERVFDLFQTKKAAIYQNFEEFPYLMENERKEAISYLDSFYDLFRKPGLAEGVILETCLE